MTPGGGKREKRNSITAKRDDIRFCAKHHYMILVIAVNEIRGVCVCAWEKDRREEKASGEK